MPKSFRTFITEIFNKPLRTSPLTTDKWGDYAAVFYLMNQKMSFVFHAFEEGRDVFQVVFTRYDALPKITSNDIDDYYDPLIVNKFDYANTQYMGIRATIDLEQDLGAEGIQVMSTIVHLTKQFIEKVKPEVFYFTSKKQESSRLKLYRRFAENLVKLYPQYDMEETSETETDDDDPSGDYGTVIWRFRIK